MLKIESNVTTPKGSGVNTRSHTPRNEENTENIETKEPTDIDIKKIKELGLNEVKRQLKREKMKYGANSDCFIRPSEEFLIFLKTELCDEILISSIFYVSSTLALRSEENFNQVELAEYETTQSDSFQIISSLYCQLLLSPISSNLPVRKERIFYETLFFFIDSCVSYVIHTISSEIIIDILSKVFRGGLQDPNSRKEIEFLPITEIVKKHWLSQRVPGKTRSNIKHSTLRGTTHLIAPLCDVVDPLNNDKNIKSRNILPDFPNKRNDWNEEGFPLNTKIPFKSKFIPINSIYKPIPIIKQPESVSNIPTRDPSPRNKK